MQLQVEDEYGGHYSCIVDTSEGPEHDVASYKRYSAWYNGMDMLWYAMCGRKGDRAPNQQLLSVLCSAAHDNCGNDLVCMRDYVKDIIIDGTVEMCRSRFNLMVTADTNYWAASGYDVENSYDGSYANCIMYCVE